MKLNVMQLDRPINQINKIEFDSHGSWIVYLYLRWEMALGVYPENSDRSEDEWRKRDPKGEGCTVPMMVKSIIPKG